MAYESLDLGKKLLPKGTNIDLLSKEEIFEVIGMNITVLVKKAKAAVDQNSSHSFKHYFKELYNKQEHNEKTETSDKNLEYMLQEKDLVVALRNIDQNELNEELQKGDSADQEKMKKLSMWIIELNAISKALTEMSRDVRAKLVNTLQ